MFAIYIILHVTLRYVPPNNYFYSTMSYRFLFRIHDRVHLLYQVGNLLSTGVLKIFRNAKRFLRHWNAVAQSVSFASEAPQKNAEEIQQSYNIVAIMRLMNRPSHRGKNRKSVIIFWANGTQQRSGTNTFK